MFLDPLPETLFRTGRESEFGGLSAASVTMNGISEYIWQRRIHHGVRHQKHAVPFPESVELGLEFNAALERKEKLDPCLLTNAVMLELCDFAKTVTQSETYFLFEMLEFNFDLGVDTDNEFQCYEYGRQIHNKIKLLKEQIKMKLCRWTETFPLPDRNCLMGFAGSEQSGRCHPKRNKMVDSSVLADGSENSCSVEDQRTERNGAASAAFILKKRGGVVLKLTGDGFPLCKERGVTVTVRPEDKPKQKLEPHLLTNAVMMELLSFSKVLCGTHTGIVYDLIKQNFGLKLDKKQLRMRVSKLMERRSACLTAEDRDGFRKEPFKVQTRKQEQDHKKRQNPDADNQELERPTMASKRRGVLRHSDSVAKEMWQDVDMSYMCPVDFETEMQSGTEAGPEEIPFKSLSETAAETKSTVSLDVKQEEEEVSVSPELPRTNSHSSSLLNVGPKNRTLKADPDVFSEAKNGDITVETVKQKLWMRRNTRSKQILKPVRVSDMFSGCREIGLDFNVGSHNKQNLDPQLLTNCVLWEVFKFAAAMTKSLRSFLLDILDNNFKLLLRDEILQRNFLVYIITKEKILQNNPDRQKMEFLSSPFHFPQVYNMIDVTSDLQKDTETEQQTNWDSPASAAGRQADTEQHPFCNQLGLNLWSTERRPASRKLDLNILTTGAVFEIFSFIRELCGAAHETVHDILEHNFDLDLRSGKTEAAQVIQRWYTTQRSWMRRQRAPSKKNRWLSMPVPLSGRSELGPEPPTRHVLEDLKTEDSQPGQVTEAADGNVPQVESFHICKKIGLDLNVSSQSEAKTKLDLRLLTRGVLFEMHRYVVQTSVRYVPALYAILEHNFDLSSQDHRREEFAWSVASQVIAMAGKNCRKGDYPNRVFELPFEVSESSQIICKEEPEDHFSQPDLTDKSDIVFVRELKPVDIEVVVE